MKFNLEILFAIDGEAMIHDCEREVQRKSEGKQQF